MRKNLPAAAASCLIALLGLSLTAHAASPQLTRVLPRGAQRGTEVELTFDGARLADAQEVLVYEPGVTFGPVQQPADAKQAGKLVKVTAKIAPDARLGQYHLRLRTATGVSELRTFWVGSLPVTAEKEPNSDARTPQAIPLNVTVAGVVDTEDQDFFVVEAKKGQRLTAEIEGMRLGETPLDPFLAILDENRAEVATNDDSPLLRQDSVVSVIAPKDGKYTILLRDSAFGGAPAAHYRLHVGTFPRPRVVFPLGGQAGKSVSLRFLGDVRGPIDQNVTLPAKADPNFEFYATQDDQSPPSPNLFRVSDFPSVIEAEPNDTVKTATPHAGEAPVAFDGVIGTVGGPGVSPNPAAVPDVAKLQDNDYFRFTAKKGQVLEVNVYARRLRSPLDPVLAVYDAKGAAVGNNDDSGGPDCYLKFTAASDGEYTVRVRDHLRGAGEQYAYRVEVTIAKPAVTLSIPQYTQQYTQERQAVTVHKGNRYATLMRVTRQDVAAGAPLQLAIPDLPAGVKVEAANLDAAVDAVPVLFEAADDAKPAGKLVEVKATAAAPTPAEGGFRQAVELVLNGNNAPFYVTTVDRMALTVAERAPFKLTLVEPKVPLVQGGQMNLKVVAERDKEFTGPINVRLLFKPTGVEAAANVEIPAGQNECVYPINAADGAAVRKWKLVVVGSSDVNGQTWVASPYAAVDVVAPFVTGKIEKASVEQGQTVNMSADLNVLTKWEGKAKVELVGLPGNTTAPEKEISADDKKVEFAVTTAKNTPATLHNGLLLRVTVMQNGEPIIHNVGRGATLRVNAPLPDKAGKNAPTTKPAKPPTTPAKPAK